MRKSLFFIIAGILPLFFSCSKEQRSDAALNAAKGFYDSLVAGNHDYFIRSTYLPDTIPTSYREQLVANTRMFLSRMKEEHRGISAVSAVNSMHDTIISHGGRDTLYTADAFLELTFGDSLKEEIVVPMILHKGRWLMR